LTEKDLNQYKAIKKEIADLNRRIRETKEGEVVHLGIVKGSSKNFPYNTKNFHINGIDPEDASRRQELLVKLLRQREAQKDELLKKQMEIENYIFGINDSTTRTIFRMYFIDELSQLQIANRTGYDQSVVSRKIKQYLRKEND
jgi:DNA-directed RNA polymerase specialized sigma subunit